MIKRCFLAAYISAGCVAFGHAWVTMPEQVPAPLSNSAMRRTDVSDKIMGSFLAGLFCPLYASILFWERHQ